MKNDSRKLQQTIDEVGPQIGERLVEFRERAGLSIQDLIDRTGLSRSGIEKMERSAKRHRGTAQSNPTVGSVELYVKACGRTLSEFFKPWTRARELQRR